MADPVKLRPQFDFSDTPGAVPTRPILPGGAAIQQADGVLLTLKSDGSTRRTPLDNLALVADLAALLPRAVLSIPRDPTTSDIPAGTPRVIKNTVTGRFSLWVNDDGTMVDLLTFTAS